MTEQGPPGFGERLRSRREQSGLTLRQIADTTKLTVRVLEAIEHERIAHLPTGIYRRAVIRAYAREVGLDPEQTLREFLAKYPDDLPAPPSLSIAEPRAVEPPRPPAPTRSFLRFSLSVLGAAAPILSGVLYFTLTARGDAPARVVDLTSPRISAASAALPAILPAAAFSEAPAIGARVSMMISVSSRTALQVIADGREVLARAVEAGEVVRLHVDRDVVLLGDDAGAVHFSINGRAGRTLGPVGSPLSVRISRDAYDDFLIQP